MRYPRAHGVLIDGSRPRRTPCSGRRCVRRVEYVWWHVRTEEGSNRIGRGWPRRASVRRMLHIMADAGSMLCSTYSCGCNSSTRTVLLTVRTLGDASVLGEPARSSGIGIPRLIC